MSSHRHVTIFPPLTIPYPRVEPPLFRPPPFTPPAVDFAQEPSHPQQNASLNFNLESAFFSSPGLSILRPSPKSSVAAQTEEHEYWAAGVEGDDAREGEGERGMTVMPLSDAFDPLEVEDECGGGGTSTATRPPRRAPTPAFETPARPSSRLGSDGTRDAYGWAGTPGLPASSGRRGRRNVSDVEAWKEMQERAWEVGMTARKLRSGSRAPGRAEEEVRAQTVGTAGNDEVAELERRRRAVLSDLDGLEEKYSRLFALANAA